VTGAPIRLLQIRDAPDAAGEVRVGLLLPPRAGSASTRPIVQVFESVGAALQAKRLLEAVDARP
jgi:hypothetical protein